MTTINYKNGKIYKIEPRCEHLEGDIYIGSTTAPLLCHRMRAHRSGYKYYKDGKVNNNVSSYMLFEKYGVDNCDIILLELVDVNSKDELRTREAYYIRRLRCVNKCIPLRTDNEYRKDNKDKRKEYLEANKDKIKEYRELNKDKMKEYRELNKDKMKDKKHIYYQLNNDKMKEYRELNKDKMKEYRELNKDKLNERRREVNKLKKLKKEQ